MESIKGLNLISVILMGILLLLCLWLFLFYLWTIGIVLKFSWWGKVLFLYSAVWLVTSIINFVCMCVLLKEYSLSGGGDFICIHGSDQISVKQVMTSIVFPPYPANSGIGFMHQKCWACYYMIDSCRNHFLMKEDVHTHRYIPVYFKPICCHNDCSLRREVIKCVY